MSLSLIDTSNLITVTSIDADGNETTTINYDYLEDATLTTIPDNTTNEQVFVHVFGVDAWKQMIEFSNLNDQFREFWNTPYKAGSEDKGLTCDKCKYFKILYNKLSRLYNTSIIISTHFYFCYLIGHCNTSHSICRSSQSNSIYLT